MEFSADSKASAPLDRLREIVATLRAPGGCPWDREQTHMSLRNGLIEEAFEVVEAIEHHDDPHFCEELGDLLLQVVMHSQIASEENRFTLDDVAHGVATKLVRRHPHVFGDVKLADTEAVLTRWDEIKRAEKGDAGGSVLDDVSKALPALMRAEKVQKRAARVGFDWEKAEQVLAKVREEIVELESAMASKDREAEAEEIGDLLFTVVNLARKAKHEPELLLRAATEKFVRRFQLLETEVTGSGRRVQDLTLEEMETIWQRVKR